MNHTLGSHFTDPVTTATDTTYTNMEQDSDVP
jgi:hypothetical protein